MHLKHLLPLVILVILLGAPLTIAHGTDLPDVTMAWILDTDVSPFHFESFKYYSMSEGKINCSLGSDGNVVPWGGTIGFSLNVTNLHPTEEDFILNSTCQMWSYFPSCPGQATGPVWFITNADETTGVISSTYTPITLAHNLSQELFFCKQSAMPTWDPLQRNQLGAINLLMYGVFTGPPADPGLPTVLEYAQNIPFISVYASDSIPEFSSLLVLPLFLAGTLIAMIFVRRRTCMR